MQYSADDLACIEPCRMPNDLELPSYHIYLLTVWLLPGAEQDEASRWRFRLEDPRSGERRGFTNAQELVAALQSGLHDRGAFGEEI